MPVPDGVCTVDVNTLTESGIRIDVQEYFGLLSPRDFWEAVDTGRLVVDLELLSYCNVTLFIVDATVRLYQNDV